MSVGHRLLALVGLVLCLISGAVRAGDALRDAGWLDGQLEAPGLVVLDVRAARAFGAGHIPGSVNLPMGGGAWLYTRYGVPHMLTAAEVLGGALGAAGISEESVVVVVAGSGDVAALAEGARAFWSLRALGHRRLHLLDGGIGAWAAAGLPLASGPGAPRPPQTYRARPDTSVIARVMHVEDAMGDNSPPIDARDRDAFDGHRVSPLVDEGGTILDAINLPAERLLGEDGRFLPVEELRQRAAKVTAQTRRNRRVVFSDTGQRAALVWFVLREVLGMQTMRLYDGSLAEWAAEDYDMYDSTDGMGGVIGG